MKKLLICALIVITGCAKKEEPTPDTMSWTVNGTTVTANSVIATVSSGRFTIDASSASGQQIELDIEDLTSGTTVYTVDSGNAAMSKAFYYANTAFAPVMSRTGTVSVNLGTANRVSGTFSVVCRDGTSITNGVFNASTL